MIYYSDEARTTATETIRKTIAKLGELKPSDSFTYSDICDTIYYLSTLKNAIRSEQYAVDRKRRENERKNKR